MILLTFMFPNLFSLYVNYSNEIKQLTFSTNLLIFFYLYWYSWNTNLTRLGYQNPINNNHLGHITGEISCSCPVEEIPYFMNWNNLIKGSYLFIFFLLWSLLAKLFLSSLFSEKLFCPFWNFSNIPFGYYPRIYKYKII